MAAFSSVLLVNNSFNKPSITPKFDHVKTSQSSTVKPFLKELQQMPMKVDVSKTIKEKFVGVLDVLVDFMFQIVHQPLLPSQRNFAPVEEIGESVDVNCCEGKIPVDFPEGIYVRNGPNPLYGGLKSTTSIFGRSSDSWVEGEGMLHAAYFKKDAQRNWTLSYNNRYVESQTFKLEKQRNKRTFLPTIEGDSPAILAAYVLNGLRYGIINKHLSNTNVFKHSGNLYAIAENYLPLKIDISTLETNDEWDVQGSWGHPFTSHPKDCYMIQRAPGSGELVIMGVNGKKPFFVVGVISADGKKLCHEVDLKYNRNTLCHEIGVTQKYNVIMDFPLTIDFERLIKGGPLLKYEKEGYARIGVMPRYGDADSVQWFDVESHCTIHILNSFEDGSEVVVRGNTALESIIPGPDRGLNKFEWFSRGFRPINETEENANGSTQDGYLFARAYEWRLNMETGEVKERYLTGTEFSMDFPFINGGFTGLKHKYGYTQVLDSMASASCGMAKFGGLAKLYFDEPHSSVSVRKENCEQLIKVEYHKFAENNFCSGGVFVSKQGNVEEDDGWVVAFVHNEDTNVSQVHIIDAKKFKNEPIAKITLPQRVPYGFHGTFVSMPSQP